MKTQNGWLVAASSSSRSLKPLNFITGRVLDGPAYELFVDFCQRCNACIERINQASSWGTPIAQSEALRCSQITPRVP